jgi:hypothetical protein
MLQNGAKMKKELIASQTRTKLVSKYAVKLHKKDIQGLEISILKISNFRSKKLNFRKFPF